jgi:hypothetical protein
MHETKKSSVGSMMGMSLFTHSSLEALGGFRDTGRAATLLARVAAATRVDESREC